MHGKAPQNMFKDKFVENPVQYSKNGGKIFQMGHRDEKIASQVRQTKNLMP